jgi:hypothetical protein
MPRVLPLALVIAAACGHSAKRVREAKAATYDAEFALVWNEVTEEIHERFSEVVVEDAVKGVIVTEYVRVHAADDVRKDPAQPMGPARLAPGQTRYGQTPFLAFRMTVEVKGAMGRKGAPWRVIVDGNAAEYKPGMAQLVPIGRGEADEPSWVQQRIDSAILDIHRRLERHAVSREIPAEAIGSKTFDTTPWANLPDRDAVTLIGRVHEAALLGDAAALRPTMIDDFRWALGGEASADTAVALWAADPTKLRDLARVIENGCAHEAATGEVVCPRPGADLGAMARFRKVGRDWKFVVFLAR